MTNTDSKTKLSRREKRTARHQHGLVRAQDQRRKKTEKEEQSLDTGRARLEQLQSTYETLAGVRAQATEGEESAAGYFKRDGVIYRKWQPAGEAAVDQIILPKEYQKKILSVAHTIPIAGHLWKKTTKWILRQFYGQPYIGTSPTSAGAVRSARSPATDEFPEHR